MSSEAKYIPKAGTNVYAIVDGSEIGPIYLVQIEGETATLQGSETHLVQLSDIVREA